MVNRILFIDDVHPLVTSELTAHGFQCDFFPGYTRQDYIRVIPEYYGVIIRSKIILDAEILLKAKNLKFIGRVGAGMESIDAEYAESHGIVCLNSPEGNRDAVGEHATGMLLSLMNHMNRADRQVREGKWIREANRGTEIEGKTVGIIGYGNMGSAFAKRLSGFGCEVISFDKYKTSYSDGYTAECTFQDIFEKADIVSLHVPLTEETRYMADEAFFRTFRKNIWLINTSRGMVVNTKDLVDSLKSGKVRGAALDVLEYEDSSFELLGSDTREELQYLMRAENVLLTPHIAGWTEESRFKLAKVLVDKIINAFTVYDLRI
ncbi:MAG: NAD(P)-binding domain-containing protein [Bacteroidetes bacterium]|nr:NAD(P)-binding domain-containing protein [Bacteroidota bacterium]